MGIVTERLLPVRVYTKDPLEKIKKEDLGAPKRPAEEEADNKGRLHNDFCRQHKPIRSAINNK